MGFFFFFPKLRSLQRFSLQHNFTTNQGATENSAKVRARTRRPEFLKGVLLLKKTYLIFTFNCMSRRHLYSKQKFTPRVMAVRQHCLAKNTLLVDKALLGFLAGLLVSPFVSRPARCRQVTLRALCRSLFPPPAAAAGCWGSVERGGWLQVNMS